MQGLYAAAPDAADRVSVLSSCRQISHPNSDFKSNCACKTGGGSTQPSQTLQITSLDGLGPVNIASDTAISPVFTLWLTLMLMFIGEPPVHFMLPYGGCVVQCSFTRHGAGPVALQLLVSSLSDALTRANNCQSRP